MRAHAELPARLSRRQPCRRAEACRAAARAAPPDAQGQAAAVRRHACRRGQLRARIGVRRAQRRVSNRASHGCGRAHDLPEPVDDYVGSGACVQSRRRAAPLSGFAAHRRRRAAVPGPAAPVRTAQQRKRVAAQEFADAPRRVRVDAGDGFAALPRCCRRVSRRGARADRSVVRDGERLPRGGRRRCARASSASPPAPTSSGIRMLARRESQELPARLRARGRQRLPARRAAGARAVRRIASDCTAAAS